MHKIIKYLCVTFFSVLLLSVEASAYVIKEGTLTIGGSAFNNSRQFDKGADSHEYGFSVNGGYFVKDNVEIGTGFSYDYYSSDTVKSNGLSVSPVILYHMPLNKNVNAHIGGGVFFTNRDNDLASRGKTSEESAGYTVRAGVAYFFNPNVSLDLDLSFSRAEWDLGGLPESSDEENRFQWPSIGFRMFF